MVDQAEQQRGLFGVGATLVIALALLVPVGVYKATGSEPFPALILPGSGTTVEVADGRVRFASLSLFGMDAGGAQVRVDPTRFLDPVPVQFVSELASASFGQVRQDRWLHIKFVDITIDLDDRHASEAEREAGRVWIAARLAEQGLDPTRLVVRWDDVTVDVDTGDEVARSVVGEQVIDLG